MKFDFARKLILIARRLTQSELSGNDWAGRNRVPVGLVLTEPRRKARGFSRGDIRRGGGSRVFVFEL